MVKHAVEHDADIARVRLVEQLPEGWRAAQQRVDREIVVGMVAVVCRRGKNRVEIQRADPQVGQIVEVFGHPEQVSALKTEHARRTAPGFQRVRLGQTGGAGKTVRKNLVEDRVCDPAGYGGWHTTPFRQPPSPSL